MPRLTTGVFALRQKEYKRGVVCVKKLATSLTTLYTSWSVDRVNIALFEGIEALITSLDPEDLQCGIPPPLPRGVRMREAVGIC